MRSFVFRTFRQRFNNKTSTSSGFSSWKSEHQVHISDQQQLLLTRFDAPSLPVLKPSICLRLSALMNSPGRLRRRHDGWRRPYSSHNKCVILRIFIMQLCVCSALTICFLTSQISVDPNTPLS